MSPAAFHSLAILTCLAWLLVGPDGSATACGQELDYRRDVKAVFKTKCYSCHGALEQEGGLRVDTGQLMRQGGDSGTALRPGSPENSLLFERITASDADDRMPPEGEPLTPEQIERVRQWIAAGAPSPPDEVPQQSPEDHWAYQPLNRTAFPTQASVDFFIDARLAKAGLERAPRATRRTLIRRLYLDMHGLPPTPQQVERFLEDDRDEAWSDLVAEVLASPRYGERWAQHWLDVVRYADTHGFEVNTPRPNAWPYRDYVIESLNSDKPYDQFVREQLAGDTLGIDQATGFLVAAPVLLPGQIGADDVSKRLARQDALDEIIVGTGATFLGLTIGCARCHDHKFDPISQQDYYALQAFFAGVDYGDRELDDATQREREQQATALEPQIAKLKSQLRSYEPTTFTGRTILIDDEDLDRVTLLKGKNGHGSNPEGSQRGYLNDVGDAERLGNISGGRYTWWDNVPGADTFTWNPGVSGRFRLWISWGVHGSGVHTRDARYVLDRDGDLSTRDDQLEIAQADQYYFSGVTAGESEQQPLWSGLADAGVHDWQENTRLILRGGDTQTGITADVIVLQEVTNAPPESSPSAPSLPALRAPVNPRLNVESFSPQAARFVRFTTLATNENNLREPCIDELEVYSAEPTPRNVALATSGTIATSSGNYSETGIHQLKHINEGAYGNSHSWISSEIGKGWVQLEFPLIETINRIEWSRDREEKFFDRLAVDYRIEVSTDAVDWTLVASSQDRMPSGSAYDPIQTILRLQGDTEQRHTEQRDTEQLDLAALARQLKQLQDQNQALRTPRMVFAGVFRQPDKTYVLHRGDPEQKGAEIRPRFPTVLSGEALAAETPEAERRQALADWIASPDNPLTARVMVNRIWQSHFGQGLVDTPSDFGMNGSPPSHPELLDWLAVEFIEQGWSIKEIHRRILLSGTYQQANVIDPEAQLVDGDCRLLWRFPSRRLEGEAIRDSMLAINGQLNLAMGGPGFDFFKTRGGLSGFPPVDAFGPAELRRMIYAHKIRMEPVPVFGAFDCPDAGQAMPRRGTSTTAIQALNLFNSPFVADQAAAFADRIEREETGSLEQKIDRVFELAIGRLPQPAEAQACIRVAREHGLATVCRVLYNSNEFLFIP